MSVLCQSIAAAMPNLAGGSTIRHRLALLVIACIVPVWFASYCVLYYTYQARRAATEHLMLDTAHVLSMTVDKEFARVQAALQVLAATPEVASNNLSAFHELTKLVSKDFRGADIILADGSGQQITNSYKEFGEQLPYRNNIDVVKCVYEERKICISNLYRGAVTKRPLISIDVPVIRDGNVIYDLSMTLQAEGLSDILLSGHLPASWLGFILDRKDIVAARTIDATKFVGQPARPELRQRATEINEGTVESSSFEGIPHVMAFSRSPNSGWLVGVGVPKEYLLFDIEHWLRWAFATALLLSLIWVAIANSVARGIRKSIQALVEPAIALGRGDPVIIPAVSIKECADVCEALHNAARVLQERQADLQSARDQAEASNAAKSVFLAMMSHEIRTPITGVLGMADLLRRTSLNGEQSEYLEILSTSTKALLTILNDLLDFSKLDAGKMAIECAEFSIPEEVTSSIATFRWAARAKNLALT